MSKDRGIQCFFSQLYSLYKHKTDEHSRQTIRRPSAEKRSKELILCFRKSEHSEMDRTHSVRSYVINRLIEQSEVVLLLLLKVYILRLL
jgi:hypothetical protein